VKVASYENSSPHFVSSRRSDALQQLCNRRRCFHPSRWSLRGSRGWLGSRAVLPFSTNMAAEAIAQSAVKPPDQRNQN
jgi:hypothetical protein